MITKDPKTIIGLIIVASLGIGLGYFVGLGVSRRLIISTVPGIPTAPMGKEKAAFPAKIAVELSPPKATLGQQVQASLVLDTQNKVISGFDIILQFDPAAWKVVSSKIEVSSEAPFSTFPTNKINQKIGEIQFSGLTKIDQSFTGKTTVGSVLLKPQRSGNLELKVVFEDVGAGNDSNLAEFSTGSDVLGEVIDGKIQVD